MATWVGKELDPKFLNTLTEWRSNCLLKNGSMFSEKPLWTKNNLSDLENLIVGNPIHGKKDFFGILHIQLNGASTNVVQLASEILWLLRLFVSKDQIKLENKNRRIIELWELSKESFPDTKYLSDEIHGGFVDPGAAFYTYIYKEYGLLIQILKQWKALNSDEQSYLLMDNPLDLCNKIDKFVDDKNRAIRHMFLYYCYPSYFEKICSTNHKREIYNAYSNLLEKTNDPYKKNDSLCGLDHAIHEIRRCLEKKHETSELDFHAGMNSNGSWIDLRSEWDSSKTKKKDDVSDTVEDVNSSTEKFKPEDVAKDLFINKSEKEHILKIWQSKKNLIIQGAPGVGKTFAAYKLAYEMIKQKNPNRVGFVQFHSSYSYEDFIQGYRPSEDSFKLQDGKFKIFCDRAHEKPNDKFVFIIDEINRGDLSKILGELLLLIEPDKRSEDWATPLTYSNTGEKFFVPDNVYLLGLMNTADRSLAVVDYALRRRFGFYEMKPQFNSKKFKNYLQKNEISDYMVQLIQDRIGDLNSEIAEERFLGPGFQIGHSFFCEKLYGQKEKEWYKIIINSQIIPLLEEYYFDKPERINKMKKKLLSDFEK